MLGVMNRTASFIAAVPITAILVAIANATIIHGTKPGSWIFLGIFVILGLPWNLGFGIVFFVGTSWVAGLSSRLDWLMGGLMVALVLGLHVNVAWLLRGKVNKAIDNNME